MSGVSLALSVVPLVISATHDAKSEKEQQLEFFQDVRDEITILQFNLRSIIHESPLLNEKEREDWSNNCGELPENIASSILQKRFGDSQDAVVDLLDQILGALESIISDSSFAWSRKWLRKVISGRTAVYSKLITLCTAFREGGAMDDARDRLRLTRNARTRIAGLRRIRESNKKLQSLLVGAQASPDMEKTPGSRKPRIPSHKKIKLLDTLFGNLALLWKEDPTHHLLCDLWLCLSSWPISTLYTDSDGERLQLLFSVETACAKIPLQEVNIRLPSEVEGPGPIVRLFVDGQEVPSQAESSSMSVKREVDSIQILDCVQWAYEDHLALDLVYEQSKLWHTKSRRKTLKMVQPPKVTLKDVFQNHKRDFRLKERRILGVLLAHALLALCGSRWLRPDWCKDDIIFFYDEASVICLRQPCLSIKLKPEAVAIDQSLCHPDPPLLGLGILLLELHMQKPIEESWLADDLNNGVPNVYTNFTTALRLLATMEDDIYEGYRQSIQACLEVPFCSGEGSNWNDEGFRRAVYNRIVIPLEVELRNGWDIHPEDLAML